MRLLICTQAVDINDPILGFFIRWIEEFAKHCEKVTVICLRRGQYTLPDNIEVIELGTMSRFLRVVHLWNVCLSHRHEYDQVFIHMNPEYIVAAGFIWRIMHKRVALWYTHKSVNLKLRIAVFFAHTVLTASAESFRLRTGKLCVMGHGIDTDFFSPDPSVPRGATVLSAGRLSPTKRHDLVIRAAEHFPNDVHIAGDGPEMQNLRNLAESLSLAPRMRFLGPQTQKELRKEYRRAGVFVHTSETGSLDKVVLEALSCGLPVITTSTVLKQLPVTVVSPTPDAIAKAVVSMRDANPQSLATYVREHHSLQHLIPAILGTMRTII